MFGLLVAAGAKVLEETEEATLNNDGLGDGKDESDNRVDEGEANEGAAEEGFSEDNNEKFSEGAGAVRSCT